MKKLTLLLLLFVSLLGFSQNKDAINYQSVIRNGSGIIVNQLVNIKLSILEATANGDVVYSETHLVTSNDYGVISLQIGNGSTETGDYSTINWGSANHFLKIEIDETGGNDFVFMGTNQFLSVPYALSAKTAEDVDDADADSQNEIQTLERTDNTLTLSKSGGTVSIADNDNDSLNEIQTLELVGNQLKISDGNSVTITGTIDLDADPTNEFQNLTLKGDSVLIANGTGIELPPTGDIDSTNEFQNLSLVNDSILISNGEGIALNDNDSLNEIQMLSISNDTVFLKNGGFVKLPVSIDNDTTNELQFLQKNEDTLKLSNGNYVLLPEDFDSDSTNELQSLSISGDSLKISNGQGVKLNFQNNISSAGIQLNSQIDLNLDELCGPIFNDLLEFKFKFNSKGNPVFAATFNENLNPTSSTPEIEVKGTDLIVFELNKNCEILWYHHIPATLDGESVLGDIDLFNDTIFMTGYFHQTTPFVLAGDTQNIQQLERFTLKISPAGKTLKLKTYDDWIPPEIEIDSDGNIYYFHDEYASKTHKMNSSFSEDSLFSYVLGYTGMLRIKELKLISEDLLFVAYKNRYPFILNINTGNSIDIGGVTYATSASSIVNNEFFVGYDNAFGFFDSTGNSIWERNIGNFSGKNHLMSTVNLIEDYVTLVTLEKYKFEFYGEAIIYPPSVYLKNYYVLRISNDGSIKDIKPFVGKNNKAFELIENNNSVYMALYCEKLKNKGVEYGKGVYLFKVY